MVEGKVSRGYRHRLSHRGDQSVFPVVDQGDTAFLLALPALYDVVEIALTLIIEHLSAHPRHSDHTGPFHSAIHQRHGVSCQVRSQVLRLRRFGLLALLCRILLLGNRRLTLWHRPSRIFFLSRSFPLSLLRLLRPLTGLCEFTLCGFQFFLRLLQLLLGSQFRLRHSHQRQGRQEKHDEFLHIVFLFNSIFQRAKVTKKADITTT